MFKRILKSVLSRQTINDFYHLPKAILANIFYGFPTKKLKVIGVTGTDGKTTTVNMIYLFLKDAGKKVSMVSTISAIIGENLYDTGFHVTSPDPFTLQKFARYAKDNGMEYLILEVTSHGLDQYRFWGIRFDIGIITNITHEHLDYHRTFENYFSTKLRLIKNVNYAIVNQAVKDNKSLKKMGKIITFGLNRGDFNQKDIKLKLKLVGDYNTENALAALACAFVLGIGRKSAQETLEKFQNLTGRMEEIKNNKGIKIFVDFAHTPNGLEQALKTLRSQIISGRLIAVFGCAGRRDIKKRFLMGEIAKKLADLVVITAEDPRGELKIINQQIKKGAEKAGGKFNKDFYIIDDREEAINFAIKRLAKKGDIIGIFGKGHEVTMNLDGKNEIPFSDLESAKGALNGKQV